MRKINFFSIFIFLAIVIVGCTSASTNEGLDIDQVLNKVEENSKNLKSVTEDVNFKIENNINNTHQEMDQKIEAVLLYGEEGTITHIHTKQKSVVDGQQQTMEFLKTPGEAYINDGTNWKKYNGSENYSTTYKPVLDVLLASQNGMKMKEEADSYVFYFKGKDAAIFNSVKVPFSISYEGVNPVDIDLDISFKIDKENMNMEDVYIGTSVFIDDKNNSDLTGKMFFYDFDKTDDIEIPKEVKNN